MVTPKLPKEIYYIDGPQRTRPYISRGHVKMALKGRFMYSLPRVRIYVAVIADRLADWPEGWTEVTREFINEDGSLAW